MARQKTPQELNPELYFTSSKGHPRDRIIIHESQDMPKEGLFLSLNGIAFLAKPDVEIDLPRPVRQMLDTRVRTETRRVDDGNGNMIVHTRNIRRFTYTLVKENVDAVAPEIIADSQGAGAASNATV
jgi:hypothetical protein